MDINFHWLTSAEIKSLQDISKIKFLPDGKKAVSFEKIRDNRVDIIICRNDDEECKDYLKELEVEAKAIKGAINAEHDSRDKERKNNEPTEEWPDLPFFNDEELNPFEWPADEGLDAAFDGEETAEMVDSQWVRQFNRDTEGADGNNKREKDLNKAILNCDAHDRWYYKEELERIHREKEQFFSELNDESTPALLDRLSNTQLLQLDDRLRQIRAYQWGLGAQRSVISWKNYCLGCYYPMCDNDGKRIFRRVYLFLDNIEDIANNDGYSREVVLCSTFIHEMFHAYHDNIETKPFINTYRRFLIPEIEEALTEFATLCFIEKFFTSGSDYFKYAYNDLSGNLKSGNPSLQCYGLGAALFDEYHNGRLPQLQGTHRTPFAGGYSHIYQTIQPAPRRGVAPVNSYLRHVRRSFGTTVNLMAGQCLKDLYTILRGFHLIIENSSQHFLFNYTTCGESKALVHMVLKYYADTRRPDWATIESVFDNTNQDFGAHHIFENVKKSPSAQHYDLDKPISLSNTDIVINRVWQSKASDNTVHFLNQVIRAKRKGDIDKRVTILR